MDLTQQPLEEVDSAPVIQAAAPPVANFDEADDPDGDAEAPEVDTFGDGEAEDE